MTLDDAFAHLYRTYFGDHPHEQAEIETLPRLLEGCEVFIDVGASLGQYTYHANQILEGARIISIEADPDRFVELERNCVKWSDGRNEIDPVHAAVADDHGTVEFFKTGSRISGGLFPVDERPASYHPVDVPQIMLDDFQQTAKTFVKIDVEGAEMRVMLGASRLIASGAEFLTEITWWGDRERGYSPFTLLRWARQQGMAVEKNTRRRNSSYRFYVAPRPTGYVKVVPLLAAKYVWGRFMPQRIRRMVERRLSASRLRHARPTP